MTASRPGVPAPRLCDGTLPHLPASMIRPAYDRTAAAIGIVHFGPGAFHRAHQAVYVDDLLAHGGDWAISGVSLQSSGVRTALAPQDGLYTLAILDETPSWRVIGSLKELLAARDDPEPVLRRLADPATRIVTMTVTEKGYCLTAGGDLDAAHPDIRRDLAAPERPVSLIGYLVEGLRRRRAAGLPPVTLVSCDNLVDNGTRLRQAVIQLAGEHDPALARWIGEHATFPNTMIDSITPATDDALRARAAAATGLTDAWPIQREAFSQWVVEDRFCNGRPDFAAVGVTLTGDVAAFDRAKLRLLNGPHSSLAYLGLLAGHETVADAMADPVFARFLNRLMREDILPTLTPPAGFDLNAYIDAILHRFANPGIRHRLAQIAWDGSQKLPFRLLGTVADRLKDGADIHRLCLPVAGWLHVLRGTAASGATLVDPLADRLLSVARRCGAGADADVAGFLAVDGIFPPFLAGNATFRRSLAHAYAALGRAGPTAIRQALVTA